MEAIRLAIVEDQKVVRENLLTYLGKDTTFAISWVATSVEDLLLQLQDKSGDPPQVVLLDIQLPGMSGVEGIHWIREKAPTADIIMLTTFEDEDHIFQALRAGACSYLSKKSSLADIQKAILTVYHGGSYMSPSIARKVIRQFNPRPQEKTSLTPRQQQIVHGIIDGLSYQHIADRLHISIDTVRSHIKKIYKHLQINSKTELIRKSLRSEI